MTAEPVVTPPLDGIVERIVIECGRHRVLAAPGMVVFVEGTWNGRQQTLAVDTEEISRLCCCLQFAKCYSRSESPHTGRLP